MYISQFKVANFKLFQDVEIHFNPTVNIITGVNNSGKTTLLQALSLWHECFIRLIRVAGRTTANYRKNDWVLGNTQEKYFPFDRINSVLSPNFEDIFFQRDPKQKITLGATITQDQREIEICFQISSSSQNYVIELVGFRDFNFGYFNEFFQNLPTPFGFFYTSPTATIRQSERFSTVPQVTESIINRESASVIRNRLYLLYRSLNSALFSEFLETLSFVLYDGQQQIAITNHSDIQKHSTVIFTFKHHEREVQKDIALLGSGTLQIIEILLNLYKSESKDLTLILLDEPDSHIHRGIQSRLLTVLTRFSTENQIFLTTHNEALIRSASPADLFHLDGAATGEYTSLNINLVDVSPRFSGIYPSPVNPVISALGGNVNGLDFVNALEADHLLLIEGADDAQAINILLKQRLGPSPKYVYWVLGGVSEVWDRIQHYKAFFPAIKNDRTLWQKSVLIIDRDFLNDHHQAGLAEQLQQRLDLKAQVWPAYTIESTLFTDLPRLARLLQKWLAGMKVNTDFQTIEQQLHSSYLGLHQQLVARYDDKKYENTAQLYRSFRDKFNALFKHKYKYIESNDIQLTTIVRNHVEQCLEIGTYYKLMTKDDVAQVIADTLQTYSLPFQPSFIDLIGLVDKSTWMAVWDFLLSL
jgi:AAA15 family ATPase/GTPase